MAIAEWTSEAVTDLEQIIDHIAKQANRRSVSRKVYDGIKSLCDDYATYFETGNALGTSRPELGEQVRVVGYQRWVILFRPYKASIQILAVFDGSREYEKVFEERNEAL